MANEGIEETSQTSKLHFTRPQPGQVAPAGSSHFYSDSACAEVKFLASQGQEPDWAKAKLDLGTRAVAVKMAAAGWGDLARLRPSEVQLRRLAGFLDTFIRHHVGPIKSLAKRAN